MESYGMLADMGWVPNFCRLRHWEFDDPHCSLCDVIGFGASCTSDKCPKWPISMGRWLKHHSLKNTSHQTWQWTVCHIAVLTVDFQASAWFPESKAAPKKCQLIGKKRPRLEIPQRLWLVTFDCAMLHHRTSAIERYQSCTAAMLQLAVFEGHMTSASVREGPILRETRRARSSWRFLVSAGLNAATNRQIAIRTIDAFG